MTTDTRVNHPSDITHYSNQNGYVSVSKIAAAITMISSTQRLHERTFTCGRFLLLLLEFHYLFMSFLQSQSKTQRTPVYANSNIYFYDSSSTQTITLLLSDSWLYLLDSLTIYAVSSALDSFILIY